MSLYFASPLGLLALLSVPLLVVWYLIQERHKRREISTFFLLRMSDPESSRTRRFDRLRTPPAFWLQLAALLLLTALLADLQIVGKGRQLRVALLLDDTASMSAFKDEAAAAFDRLASDLSRLSDNLDWHIFALTQPERTIYRGRSAAEARSAIIQHGASAGTRDSAAAIAELIERAGAGGKAIFLTDQRRDFQPEVKVISIGSPIENVGLSGGTIRRAGDGWTAEVLLRNFGSEMQRRRWRLEQQGAEVQGAEIELAPGELRTIRVALPGTASEAAFRLDADRFELDDYFPMVTPQRRTVLIENRTAGALNRTLRLFLERFSDLERATTPSSAHVTVESFSAAPRDLPGATIQFYSAAEQPQFAKQRSIGSSRHPLVRGLAWQTLSSRAVVSLPLSHGDEALVWQDGEPLVVLRRRTDGVSLIIGFDLRYSNAARLPALVIMLNRFFDELREEISEPQARNFDTAQVIRLPRVIAEGWRELQVNGARLVTPASELGAAVLFAPERPGYFTVHHGDRRILHGAASLGDSRESDFSEASSSFPVFDLHQEAGAKGSSVSRTALRELPLGAAILLLLWLSWFSEPLFRMWRQGGGK